MKKIIAGVIGLTALGIIFAAGAGKPKEETLQQDIARKIIRFHVIANSDSSADQELKLQVKEEVVRSMEPMLQDVENVDEARQAMELHMDEIEETAKKTLEKAGCDDEVHAELTHCYFPVKTYGQYTFPDGEYEALRIVIGNGEGKNWWCVMYPRLCFVDSLYTVVPETSQKELKAQLTEEEYQEILTGKKKVHVKCKLFEVLGLTD